MEISFDSPWPEHGYVGKSVAPALAFLNDFRRPLRPRGGPSWHRHDCWQIEAVLTGACELHHADGCLRLEAGMVAAIPPGIAHGFRYDGSRIAWISVKATLPGLSAPAPVAAAASLRIAALVGALQTVLGGSPATVAGITYALAAEVLTTDGGGAAGPVARALAGIAAHEDAGLTVDALAEQAGVSANHLATLFRDQRLGTPKQAIDAARARRARALLADADLPLAAVAEALGFADRFAFSRFVRRTTGRPPGFWRRQAGGTDQ
jgi:AraC-like DNA-binding protein